MRIKQKFDNIYNPIWLINLDGYLLLNYPRLWVTKLHYVFYYGLLINVVLFLLVWIAIKPHQLDEFINWIIPLVMVIELFIFIFWFFKQLQFNVEKEFGDTNYIANFLAIVFYIICTLIIISPSFFMTLSAIHTVARTAEIDTNTNCLQYFFNEKSVLLASTLEKKNIQKRLEEYSIFFFYEKDTIGFSKLLDIPTKEVFYISDVISFCESIKSFNNKNEAIQRSHQIRVILSKQQYLFSLRQLFYYPMHFLLCTLLSILGILFLIIRKNSNWKIIGYIILYIIVFLTIFAVASVLIDQLAFNLDFINLEYWKINDNNEKIVLILLSFVSFVMLCQSIFLTFTKKYNYFAYISTLSLPIAIYIFIFMIGLFKYESDYREITKLLIISFIPYLFIYPLHKKILVRALSLPKK